MTECPDGIVPAAEIQSRRGSVFMAEASLDKCRRNPPGTTGTIAAEIEQSWKVKDGLCGV
jgi:hypothetical protein